MKTVDVTEADAEHRSTVHHNRLYAVVTSKGRIWCKHRVLVPFSVFGCFDKAMLLSKFQRCSSFVGLLLMMSLGGPSPVPLLAFLVVVAGLVLICSLVPPETSSSTSFFSD